MKIGDTFTYKTIGELHEAADDLGRDGYGIGIDFRKREITIQTMPEQEEEERDVPLITEERW